jgi:tRNA-splicing ligase RtcB
LERKKEKLMNLKKLDDYRYEVPKTGQMRVPGIIYANEHTIKKVIEDKAVQQVENVATLPGIEKASLAMPDVHWGYGFPIGGVAAFRVSDGVISPGGIGYDINCGVRLLRTNLTKEEIKPYLEKLVYALFNNVPSGVGSTGKLRLSIDEVKEVLKKGAKWALQHGFGSKEDLEFTEENGCMEDANPEVVSERALERGREQLGTLGAGNHFLEVQYVEQIYDENVAKVFGLFKDQVTVLVHTGSRGLGYQICDDYIRYLQQAVQKYGIWLPDRQLVCAPIDSPEGKRYFQAMAAAANYAWANRQIITHWVRETIMHVLNKSAKEIGLEQIYDVAHNIGKFEEYNGKKYVVHRKGATRAFPKGFSDIPQAYKDVGQPVLVPGSMGTASYVLVGTEKAVEETWGSTCHGAGRVSSRSAILKSVRGEELAKELREKGILVKSDSWKTLAEEAPQAYKNVDEVVEICHQSGISRKVARLKPLAVIKG